MSAWPEGHAVVYCEGAFGTPNGLLLWDRSRLHFVAATTDPAERDFLAAMGNVIDLVPSPDPFFANSLQAEIPRDGFTARLLTLPGGPGLQPSMASSPLSRYPLTSSPFACGAPHIP